MDPSDDHTNPLEPRLPATDDLVFLCRRLNEAGARYLVLGGFAIIQHGFARATEDIDILIDTAPENFAKVKSAMMGLPDGAIREIVAEDFEECLVVRISDEFVVDLRRQACGIRSSWRTKQTHREKDSLDRMFLAELLKQRGETT